jgi:hypothetical protein
LTSGFELESKLGDVGGSPSSKEGADKRGSGKKRAAVLASQNQDLLRWSKAECRLSTQKYIAVDA